MLTRSATVIALVSCCSWLILTGLRSFISSSFHKTPEVSRGRGQGGGLALSQVDYIGGLGERHELPSGVRGGARPHTTFKGSTWDANVDTKMKELSSISIVKSSG